MANKVLLPYFAANVFSGTIIYAIFTSSVADTLALVSESEVSLTVKIADAHFLGQRSGLAGSTVHTV